MFSLCKGVIGLAILLATSVHAQQSLAPNSGHFQAIQQLLKATAFAELAIAGFRNRTLEEQDPVQAKLLADYANDITSDEIIEKASPIYLKYITQQHAIEVTRFYRTALGRKMIGGMLKDAAAGRISSFDKSQFTPTELIELEAFAITAAARAWQAASTLASAESKEMFTKLAIEITRRQATRAANRLADQMESRESNGTLERGQSTTAFEGKTAAGSSLADMYVGVMIDYRKRMADLSNGFERDIKEIGIATILVPTNLVTKAGIEEGQRKIAVIGERLERHLKLATELTDALRRQMRDVPAPDRFRQGFMAEFEKGMADLYDLQLRAGENQRNLLDLMRRILALADSHLGSISYRNNQLVFADSADLETYRTLLEQVNIEAKREQDLQREAAEARQQAIAELRNPAKAAPSNTTQGNDSKEGGTTNKYRITANRDSDVGNSFSAKESRLPLAFGAAGNGYIFTIKEKVLQYWVTPINTPTGLSCTVSVVQDTNGTVKNARVTKCDGGDILKRSIERAVIDASPLPLPKPGEGFKPILELTFVTDGSTIKEKVFLPRAQIQESPASHAGAEDATGSVIHEGNLQPAQSTAQVDSAAGQTGASNSSTASKLQEIARLEAQINRDWEQFKKRPWRRFIGANPSEFRFANYSEKVFTKLRKAAEALPGEFDSNQPYRSIQVSISIRADGTVEKTEINRTSGSSAVDGLIPKLMELAGPFEPFPEEIRKDTDILSITRTFQIREPRSTGTGVVAKEQTEPMRRIAEAIGTVKREYIDAVDDTKLVSGCQLGIKLIIRAYPSLVQSIDAAEKTWNGSVGVIGVTFGEISRQAPELLVDGKILAGCLQGMLEGLDRQSAFLDEEELSELQAGNIPRAGIGVELGIVNHLPKIVAPLDGSPADRAGLVTGDVLTSINDVSMKNVALKDVVKLLRGGAGSKVVLTITRAGKASPLRVELAREVVRIQSVRWKSIADGFAYMRIARFDTATLEKMAQALSEAYRENQGELKGLILDLRNNPGGILNVCVGVTSAFLPAGRQVVETKGRATSSSMQLRADPVNYVRPGTVDHLAALPMGIKSVPMAVLVNQGSAACSEIVAAALQDHKRAVIYGTHTMGRGLVATAFPMTGNIALKLTTAKYFRPSGNALEEIGVTPDTILDETSLPTSKWGSPDDTQLTRAVQFLRGPVSVGATDGDKPAGVNGTTVFGSYIDGKKAAQVTAEKEVPATGGSFQVVRIDHDSAELLFFGWNKDLRRNINQIFEVKKGNNEDTRIAVVRKMISIIREYEQGDFLWESQRLGRSLKLSARARDNAALEESMMQEFFSVTRHVDSIQSAQDKSPSPFGSERPAAQSRPASPTHDLQN